ncbi:MAG TPA: hypothetical protein VGC72_12335 [Candidatus Elarobacter sp.]|jgi:hypothetical protein
MTSCIGAVGSEEVRNWLLDAPIQPEIGEHRGAVAGWLDESKRPAFVYGEATGYYLTCGDFIARHDGSERLRRRLDAAAGWLHAVWQTAPPPTRHYLASAEPDWRNDVVFTFDCAMMLRGLNGFDTESARRTRRAIEAVLVSAVATDGTLRCYVPRAGNGVVVPERWSTTTGPFQLKTAAATLSAPDLSTALRASAETTALRWLDWYPRNEPSGELHALLYHVEGLLLWGAQRRDWTRWRLAAELFAEVMARQREDGDLPGTLGDDTSPSRSDVTAQALRIGSILAEGGFLTGDCVGRLPGLAEALQRYIDASGGVHFRRRNGAATQVNVWCAVFAYQALCLFERAGAGEKIDERILDVLA